MRYLFVVCGHNGKEWVERCLDSIDAQEQRNFSVCVVDDASTDKGQGDLIRAYCDEKGWISVVNKERMGSMFNQATAWNAMEPEKGDVIVWVDLDDSLATPRVLDILSTRYRKGALLTYGSYRSEPYASTCPTPKPYPPQVSRYGTHRDFMRRGGGVLYNHLRTVSWDVLRHLTLEDLQDDDGNWFMSAPDAAVMLPCLELAGTRAQFINQTLYVYNSSNPNSEWRRWPDRVNVDHQQIINRPCRKPLRG